MQSDPDLVEDDAAELKPAKARTKVFKVRAFIDPKQLQSDLSYSLVDLSKAMSEQGSLFIHYASLMARASRQVDDVSMLLEITESRIYRKLRDEAAKSGSKMTETQLEKEVNVHPQMIAMKRAKNEAKQIEGNAKAAVEAFRQRRDMLIQEGATQRAEIERGATSINARNERGRNAADIQARMRARLEENQDVRKEEI
jgi:hypothetical protein